MKTLDKPKMLCLSSAVFRLVALLLSLPLLNQVRHDAVLNHFSYNHTKIQTDRHTDRPTDRSTYQAHMLIFSCFCSWVIFVIIVTRLFYGFLLSLPVILALLRMLLLFLRERVGMRGMKRQN